MRILIIFIFFLSTLSLYPQWEKTGWKCEPLISRIYPFGDTLIMLTEDGGDISLDNGKKWNNLFDKSKQVGLSSILVSEGKIYISTSFDGLMFSSNLGKSWELRNNGLTNTTFLKIFIKGGKLFAGTSGSGIFVSTDDGMNWVSKNNGMIGNRAKYIQTLAFDNDRIFAGTAGGVYLSTDDGETWQFKNEGLPEVPYPSYFVFNKKGEIFLLLENEDLGYHRFYLSKDYGNTWNEKPNNIEDGRYSISYTSFNDTLLFAADNNLYLSVDFADTWIKLSQINEEDWELYSLSSFGDELYVCLGGLAFKSTDFGKSWIDFRPMKYKYSMVNSLAMINDKIIVSTDKYYYYLNKPGIYLSSDLGDTWYFQTFKDSLTGKINTFSYGNTFLITSYFDFFISSNGGDTWVKKINRDKLLIYDVTFSGDSLFAGVDWEGVYISPDMGETWEKKNSGLPEELDVYDIAILGNYLFASIEGGGIFRSTDRGENWQPINNGLPQNGKTFAFALIGSNLYAGVTDNGVYVSSNLGETWERRNKNLPDKPDVRCFYNVRNTIFVGINNRWNVLGGVFISTDNGYNWILKSGGIRNKHFSEFADNGEYIFVATNHGSTGLDGDAIYRAKLSDLGITTVEDKQNNSINEIFISPNPATDNITISFANSELTNLSISIFNSLGIEIKHFGEKELFLKKSIIFSTENFPSGIYYCSLNSGMNRITKSFVVVR